MISITAATSTPNTTMAPKADMPKRVITTYSAPRPRMQACSLKFCTAIERPAPIRLWPRCCSSAFIGTIRKPQIAPITMRKGTACASVWM